MARPQRDTQLEERLRRVESDVREVRARVNTLFYSVLTVALLDLLGRIAFP